MGDLFSKFKVLRIAGKRQRVADSQDETNAHLRDEGWICVISFDVIDFIR